MCHVAYACNDEYAVPLGVSLYSLFESNKDLSLRVHVFSDGISDENKRKFQRIAKKFSQVLIIQNMPNLNEIAGENLYIGQLSLSTYLRIFLERFLPNEVDKVLWIDCDTVVAGSVEELFDEDIDDFAGAACLNTGSRSKRLHGFKKTDSYYNVGVFLLNLRYWRKHGVYEEMLSEIARRRGKAIDHDQDLLNCVLRGRIKTLSPKFNFITHYGLACEDYDAFLKHTGLERCETYSLDEIEDAQKDVRIYHLIVGFFPNFTRDTKYKNKTVRPWFSNASHPFGALWNAYLEKTEWRGTKFPLYTGKIKNDDGNSAPPIKTTKLFVFLKNIKRRILSALVYDIPITRKIYVRCKYGFWHK